MIQLGMLKQLANLCKEHNLTFWIEAGTLLGAVRHKGFIPWDDDIDVAMPLDDYNRFIALGADALGPSIFLQTRETDPEYNLSFAKLRHTGSTIIDRSEPLFLRYHKGIYLDVFPFTSYPCARTRKLLGIDKLQKLALSFHWHLCLPKVIDFRNACSYVPVRITSIAVNFFLRSVCRLFNSTAMSPLPHDNFTGVYHPLTTIFPLKTIQFEDSCMPCPADPHKYLSSMYGDYLTPPELAYRRPHALFIDPDRAWEL